MGLVVLQSYSTTITSTKNRTLQESAADGLLTEKGSHEGSWLLVVTVQIKSKAEEGSKHGQWSERFQQQGAILVEGRGAQKGYLKWLNLKWLGMCCPRMSSSK